MPESFVDVSHQIYGQKNEQAKKIINIIIVEDDPADRDAMINAVENHSDYMKVVGFTDSSEEALSMVLSLCPDTLILDLELHYGEGDGMTFLQKLKDTGLSTPPFIVVTTHNISKTVLEAARALGADYIFVKRQREHTAKEATDFILSARNFILGKKKTSVEISHTDNETKNQINEKRYLRPICKELDALGVNPRLKGYSLLAEAILLVIEQRPERICVELGKRYKKASSTIERAMQNAINRTWSTVDIDQLQKVYTARVKSERGVPTLNEFIFFFARKIQLNY